MGKGNRTRNERAAAVLAAPKTNKQTNKKKGMPTWVGTLIVVAVVVALALIVTFCVLNARGTFNRMRIIAESENYEVTVPMMTYLISTEYQNTMSMYSQYTSGTGSISIGAGEGGTALKSNGSYTLTDLKNTLYSSVTGEDGNPVQTSWFDYFAAVAEKDVRQILACCEDARKAGMSLSDEELATIQQELDMLETYATLYGYTTNGYISTMYGNGVILKDVRKMMELTQLAASWSGKTSEEFLNAVTDERILAYYEENKKTLDVYCDYLGYTFSTSFKPAVGDGADEKNATAAADYKAEQERFAGYVAELEACTSKEDFSGKLYTFLLEEEKIALAKEKEKEVSALTGEEIAECDKEANAKLLAATKENAADGKSGDTTLDDWLFETTGEGDDKTFVRKPGEKKKFENATEVKTEGDEAYKEATSTYGVYWFADGMHRDNGKVRDVGHILFKSETFDGLKDSSKLSGKTKELADRLFARGGEGYTLTAYAMAGELIDVLKEEGKLTRNTRQDGSVYYTMDKSVFEEYGNTYTEDSNVFYEGVGKGQMVAEFENWLFDGKRVVGEFGDHDAETQVIEPTKTTYGYHIMYYIGNENDAWKYSVKNTIGENDQTKYLTDVQTTHPVTINSKYYKYI